MLVNLQELRRQSSHHSMEVITDIVRHFPAYAIIFIFHNRIIEIMATGRHLEKNRYDVITPLYVDLFG